MAKHIVCVIQTLRLGGGQQVLKHLCNYWLSCGYEVSLVLFCSKDDEQTVELSEKVKISYLDILYREGESQFTRVKRNAIRLFRLRKEILDLKPDCVVGFMIDENLATSFALYQSNAPLLLVEHCPTGYDVGFAKEFLRKIIYPTSDRIVLLTERTKANFSRGFQEKSDVIVNPIVLPKLEVGRTPSQKTQIIASGRLVSQKRFDLLIEAFAKIEDKESCVLNIYGEGVEREKLEKQIVSLGLNEQVFLKGYTSNIFEKLRDADLFVMSSDNEGYPMALAEALKMGLPCVSTDCPTGPSEMIKDGVNGLLVPVRNVDALSRAISRLLSNDTFRMRLGEQAKNSMAHTDLNVVGLRYNQSLDHAMKNRKGNAVLV